MNIMEAIRERHSVRRYMNRPIEEETRTELDAFVEDVNKESGLHIRVCYDDPEGFDSRLAHYGRFDGVENYIVLAGEDCPDFDERCGYYGEKIVIKAQMLGLNTCWAAMTFNKKFVKKQIPEGEKLCMVISLGYGVDPGKERKSKSFRDVTEVQGDIPGWFRTGVEAALLAPTAMNQQKFRFIWKYGEAKAKVSGFGSYTKVDLGIAKYHFEAASGKKVR